MGDINTPLTPMYRSTKQKINKETHTLNDTIDQLDLIDIYRKFHLKTMKFNFFLSAHGTFDEQVESPELSGQSVEGVPATFSPSAEAAREEEGGL